jgi:hypothetical protein
MCEGASRFDLLKFFQCEVNVNDIQQFISYLILKRRVKFIKTNQLILFQE